MIYIHVPLCRSFCTYCGFYSEVADAACKRRYLDALTAEILSAKGKDPGLVNTLYFGGGTPSLLSAEDFARILAALDGAGFGSRFEELTVEANPEDIVEKGPGYVEALLELGVNRFSLGIQSLDEGILRWMNRRHDAARALRAAENLRAAGVKNLSVDLIFGVPGLTVPLWQETVTRLLDAVAPEHLSAYQLSIEEGSALEQKMAQGACGEVPEETCRAQYDGLCDEMRRRGYEHYEISNFALPGFRSRHNSAYWMRVPYLGFGGGAHSFDGRTRSWNTPELSGYHKESEILTEEDAKLERIMLSLRMSDGAPEKFLHDNCNTGVLGRLLSEGALVQKDGRIRIPEDRFFVSDEIIRELI